MFLGMREQKPGALADKEALRARSPQVSTPARGLRLDECCEKPPKKMVAFGADEPNSSEPAKALKEGVCQM